MVLRAGLALWFVLPLVPLLLWAAAERWSAPAALPQRWGGAAWVEALDAGVLPALARSTLLGAAVAALATPAGAWAARALTSGVVRRPRLVTAVLLAPVALPPFAVVMGLNVLLLRVGVPASAGVVLVLVVAALPYTTMTLRAAYAGHDSRYEEEARLLGARPSVVRRRIRLPMLAPATATAAFLAFLVGWSDYVVTVLIGGGRLITAPVLLASAASGTGNDAVVAVLAVVSLTPPIVLLVLVGAAARGPRWSRATGAAVPARVAGEVAAR